MLETAPAPLTATRLEDRDRLATPRRLLRGLEATTAPTVATIIAPLGDLHVELSNLQNECGIAVSMHPDKEVRDTAERLQRGTSDLGQAVLQSSPIYDALGRLDRLGPLESRFVELVRMDMKRAGVEPAFGDDLMDAPTARRYLDRSSRPAAPGPRPISPATSLAGARICARSRSGSRRATRSFL